MNTKIRVLMHGDSPEDAELLMHRLKQEGISFEVYRTDTRETFLEQLEEFRPNIVTSDYSLSSFSGLDALELLRDRSLLLAFILVSGHIGGQDAIEALKSGATDFVLKDGVDRLAECVRRALQEAEDRAEYTRESERFRALFESAPNAMLVIDAVGQIEMLNKQAEQMFGYPSSELLGRPIDMLISERSHANDQEDRSSIFLTTRPVPFGAEAGLSGLTRDLQEFPIDVALNPMETENGVVVLAVIVDISERRKIETEKEQQRSDLERLNTALMRSNADLEGFVHVASHDLKAPLRAITCLAEWIREDIKTTAGPETLENLKLLESRAARLQTLLDGLLAYSRIGRVSCPIENVDIPELIHEIVATLAPPPGFVISCTGKIPSLRTHRAPILSVLLNLIANGVKHHDRAEGCVTVFAQVVDELVEFRISDDGPGIPPRYHERIFLIFQTLRGRDELDSNGIGLTIVKKEIESHGGWIRVESAPPERGTTFVFTWRQREP
jgi:PAS domain S-box-containing protein